MAYVLGDEFSLKSGKDTFDFRIDFRKSDRYNFIIDQADEDTLFAGTVSQYRGLYYFNQQFDDTTYWISAVAIDDGLIRGLDTEWYQMSLLDEQVDYWLTLAGRIRRGSRPSMIKHLDPEQERIRLTPRKKEMRILYTAIIDSVPVDTLIGWAEPEPAVVGEIKEEILELGETIVDELEMIRRIYPNPATDHVNVEIHDLGEYQFGVYDNNGRLVSSGQFNQRRNRIDLGDMISGTYFIRVYAHDLEDTETAKVIVEK